VTVTVQSVKVRELPALDDEFAQLASEFDTLDELREDTSKQLERMKKLQQATQARDKAIDAVVDSIDIPLPEKFVEHELTHARENIDNQLTQMNMSKEDYLKTLEKTEEEFDADLVEQSQRSVRVSFVLDEVARSENLSVNQAELSYFVADQAQRMGISPEYFARQLTESGQVGVAITEVLRGKAATLTAERVTVTDDKGETVDVKAEIEGLNADVDAMLAAQAAADAAEADIEVEDLAIDVAAALEAEEEAEDEDEDEVILEAVAEAEAEAEVVDEAEAIVEDAEDDEDDDEDEDDLDDEDDEDEDKS
jgi:AraC-like DNA-binding protein